MIEVFGRQSELDTVQYALRRGEQTFTARILRGDPGAGKSYLLDAARRDLDLSATTVLSAKALPSETHLPYAGLHQLLRPVLSQADTLPPRQRSALLTAFGMDEGPTSEIFLVGLATLELLGALSEVRPVVLTVDDVPWLDPPSAEVLSFVARRLESEAVTVLLTARHGDHSPLLELDLPELNLGALEEKAAQQLLDAAHPSLSAPDRERFLTAAQGNPLALVELPRAEADVVGTPGSARPTVALTARLERAFTVRLRDVPEEARAVLLVAAANDSERLQELLLAGDELLGQADAASPQLDLLAAAGLLTVEGSRVGFRHPLIQSAVYRKATPSQRRSAHGALANVLVDDADRRTWHRAIAAVRPDEAVALDIEAAAHRALARGLTAAGVSALERAALLSPDPRQRSRRLLQAGEHAEQMGDPGRALDLAEQVDPAFLERSSSRRLRLLRESLDTSGYGNHGRVQLLVECAEEAARDADTDLALAFLKVAAHKLWVTDQSRGVRAGLLAAAERMAPRPDDPRLLSLFGFTDPEGHGPVLRERARSMVPATLDAESALMLGSAINLAGAFDVSAPFLDVAADAFREQGRIGRLPETLCHQAWTALHRLDWSVALPAAEEASRLAVETNQPIWRASASMAQAMLMGLRGATTDSERLCDEAESIAAPLGARAMLCGLQLTRGITALGAGQYERAYEQLRRPFDPNDPSYHHFQSAWAVGDLAEAAIHSGHAAEARDIFESLVPLAASTASSWLQIGLAYARPLLAAEGDAERLFRQALESDLTHWPLYRARLQLELGRWLRRRRRVTESRAPLRAATEAFGACGVHSFGALARIELRAAGEGVPEAVPESWTELSPQELHIARLVAQGLSNRDIGERLYLSHRTVGSHLYRIFPKLGVTSRAQVRDRLG